MGPVGDLVEVLVRHEGGDATAHLVVVHLPMVGAQQHKKEAHWDGDLGQRVFFF